jgi:hypothetical protein
MSIILSTGGNLWEKKMIFWEIQLFSLIRNFSDGITFFNFKINLDRYEDDHSPAFQIELTLFNFYSHLWIYQNNYKEKGPVEILTPEEYKNMCQSLGYKTLEDEAELDNLATDYLDQGVPAHLCYKLAYKDLMTSKNKELKSDFQ